MLDTRGFILHLQDQESDALADMDRAVKGADDQVAYYRGQLRGETKEPEEIKRVSHLRPKTRDEVDPPRTAHALHASAARAAAVIHYHRSLVLSALDRQEEANQERDIARKLAGREPDETLF